jgi:PTS system sucrose-specific IIC component
MYNVIEAGMLSSVGLNTWMPIATAANFAQFGACLAVGIKCKQGKLKTVAIPSSMSAALGITEPAIFGVNFRFMKPFVCGMIGGACGAIFGAITKIGATAYGVTGIPGYLTINNYGLYTILLLISGGIAFGLTMVTWKEDIPEGAAVDTGSKDAMPAKDVQKNDQKAVQSAASTIKSSGDDVTKKLVITSSAGEIALPTPGKVIPYTEIPDPTFASGALGEGVGVEPEEGVVYAPMDGEISSVADSKHAIGITGENDQELLIHVGVDTVEMKGDGFNTLVEEGDMVKKGQKIMEFSLQKIKEAGHPDTVVVLLTNSDDYEDVKYGDI